MNDLSLSRFQTDFAKVLLGDACAIDPVVAGLAAQPAFAVYRNGVMKGAVDALERNYPAVARLVGTEWFRAAACDFVRHSPPASPMLVEYGAGFAAFLADFEPAADLPYLADVARLDRMWTEAHIAADAAPLVAATLAKIPPEIMAETVLELHPTARWAWFDATPAYTLWSRNRTGGAFDPEIDWIGEGALLTRPSSAVIWCPLDRAGCAFLDACLAGERLMNATQAAIDIDPDTDLSRLVQTLIAAGTFRAPHPTDDFLGDER